MASAESGSKQRSVVLADLASAHGDDGDRAADYLGQALAALRADWYGTGLRPRSGRYAPSSATATTVRSSTNRSRRSPVRRDRHFRDS